MNTGALNSPSFLSPLLPSTFSVTLTSLVPEFLDLFNSNDLFFHLPQLLQSGHCPDLVISTFQVQMSIVIWFNHQFHLSSQLLLVVLFQPLKLTCLFIYLFICLLCFVLFITFSYVFILLFIHYQFYGPLVWTRSTNILNSFAPSLHAKLAEHNSKLVKPNYWLRLQWLWGSLRLMELCIKIIHWVD